MVETISRQIHSGELAHGHRLEGENQLAQTFSVSRGTIRQALSELQHRHLITTQSGIGSFVTFDGHQLSQRLGWARALAQSGSDITTEVLSIEAVPRAEIPHLPPHVQLDTAIAVRRIRSLTEETPTEQGDQIISFECASVPSTRGLEDLPRRGLTRDSLWETLQEAGLVASRGEQSVDVHCLDTREAAILRRPVGTPFLRSVRTSWDSEGNFVEHVVSLLDPQRFTLTSTFGEDS